MEEIIASVGEMVFDIERDLDEQVGALPLPFSGMDKSGSATCVFHLRGSCHRASMCPYRHIKPDRTVVCKHWLRGLCKKGDSCEFLHEYDMSKMPECYFYSKFRACSNKECPFLHIDPESKVKDCPWYDRGFCRHGPNCRHRHTRRVACINYLCGFCPDGSGCKFVHMRFDIPSSLPPTGTVADSTASAANSTIPMIKKGMVICHYCNEVGHKIYTCNAIPPDQKDEVIQKFTEQQQQYYASHNENRPNNYQQSSFHHHHHNPNFQHTTNGPSSLHNSNNSNSDSNPGLGPGSGPPGKDSGGKPLIFRPLDQVTCFKCGEKGHYANKCPKGYLAFLSPALKDLHKRNEAGGVAGAGGPGGAPAPGSDS